MLTEKGKATAVLKIHGMDRPGRAQELRRAADKLDGVLRVDINYISETATIEYDADRLTLAQVAEPIRGISSRGPVRTSKYVQGKRGKGEINRNSRWRERYGRTQRGRLGE
jgi:cation transport ATPase